MRSTRLTSVLAVTVALGGCTVEHEPDRGEVAGEDAAAEGGAAPADPQGGTGGGEEVSCVDYAHPENYVSGVAFSADVLPIFQAHCTAGACHASSAAQPMAGLKLGPALGAMATPAEIDAVYAAIVGVGALRANMKLVAPGDPAASFLLLKTEHTEIGACEAVACKSLGCGVRMPAATTALDDAELAVLRGWIKDGAQHN